MGSIFRFLFKYYFFFLFLLLEGISLVLLVNTNKHHRTVMFSFANETRGSVFSAVTDVTGYFGLEEENDRLTQQNLNLQAQLKESFLLSDSSYSLFDSLGSRQYEYTTGRVISSGFTKKENYIMLNRGASSGVEKDMGVVGPNGVVGIVVGASKHFSKVMPMLHSAALISCKIKGSNHLGPVTWDGKDIAYAQLVDIPGHADVVIGDTVVTSGYSFIFPENIPVGVISSFEYNSRQNYFEIELKLTSDFSALNHIYIINNRYRTEQDSLLMN